MSCRRSPSLLWGSLASSSSLWVPLSEGLASSYSDPGREKPYDNIGCIVWNHVRKFILEVKETDGSREMGGMIWCVPSFTEDCCQMVSAYPALHVMATCHALATPPLPVSRFTSQLRDKLLASIWYRGFADVRVELAFSDVLEMGLSCMGGCSLDQMWQPDTWSHQILKWTEGAVCLHQVEPTCNIGDLC